MVTFMNRMILLNPGPVNVTERVRRALLQPDLCHREPECAVLMQSIRRKLLQAFGLERTFTPALITGSGTAALEMAVSSCPGQGQSLFVIRNGVYGERIATMAEAHGITTVNLDYDWGVPPKLEDVEAALQQHPETGMVAVVHHETTTGLLNPVHEIGELAHRHGKQLLVDAISSLAGDTLDFERAHVDYCVGTANKCVQGFPGVSFVLVRNETLNHLAQCPTRSVYCDLYKSLTAQENGDMLFTPAVQVHYALEAALDELIEETLPGRIERYAAAANLLRKGFDDLSLEYLVDAGHRSNCLTALKLPEGIAYGFLHDQLKEKGFVIYAGQGGLKKSIFRIANMGDIRTEEFQHLLDVLKECLVKSSSAQG
jgi:2-aminoethylphosphonate-pyruvate transaminase